MICFERLGCEICGNLVAVKERRRFARVPGRTKLEIKQKMNVIRSLLEDIKTKHLQWYGHVQRMEEG